VYYFKRILAMIPLVLLISLMAFLLVRVAPGGPFDKERAPASPEVERALNEKYRLDQPVWKQYFLYLGDLARGDLGPSMKYRHHSVGDIIVQGLPTTLALGGLSFMFALGVGIPLGFITAMRKGRWQDYAGSVVSLVGICIPAFVIGPLLVMAFAIHWQWFPVGLWGSPMHLVLPTTALGLFYAARVSRLMREGMLNTLDEGFIMTARSKGVTEKSILLKHAFKPAVLPVVSYMGPMLADLLTGSFVIENLFQIPGIGVFMVNSSLNKDYTMICGLVILYASLLLVLNLIVDFIYSTLDPQVKYE
jgi:oligopeptide transport system permease protein